MYIMTASSTNSNSEKDSVQHHLGEYLTLYIEKDKKINNVNLSL